MTEPDVALTDYLLALECALFASLICFRGNTKAPLRLRFSLFFASIGVATLAGGTVHGFFLDTTTLGYRILWPVTLMASGSAALAAWTIAARLWLSEKMERWVVVLALLEFVGYCAVVLFFSQQFSVAVANYLPPAFFLLAAFYKLHRHMRIRALRLGTLGFALTFIAAAVQQAGVGLHPVYFNHNALYHVIQALALFYVFLGAHWLVNPLGKRALAPPVKAR
jgi:hypothetical protein